MKKQTTEIVAYCSLLLSLITISSPISGAASSFMGTSKPPTSGTTEAATARRSERHSHVDTHKRWKRKIDDMETTIDKLEEKAKTLKESSRSRIKADNILKKIRTLQRDQKDIPGKIYRLMMDLKAHLATV